MPVGWQKVLMIGKAYTWRASGLVAVTAVVGRLFHKGLCEGRRSTCRHWCWWQCVGAYKGVLSVCEDVRAGRRQEWGGR